MTAQPLAHATRLKIAGMTASCGFATSIMMSEFSNNLHRHLPEHGFHLSAVLGAGLAGFILADGFGRQGYMGAFWASLTAVFATLMGASLGSLLLSDPALGLLGVVPGWFALSFGVNEGIAGIKVWGAMMFALNFGAAHVRAKDTAYGLRHWAPVRL